MNRFKKKNSNDEGKIMKCYFRGVYSVFLLIMLSSLIFPPANLLAQTEADKIICPQCGKTNDRGANFCWNDGYDLSNIIKIEKKEDPTEKAIPVEKPGVETQPQTRLEKQFMPIGELSKLELEMLIEQIAEKLQSYKTKNPTYISDLTQAQFVTLLKNTLNDEKLVRTRVVKEEESGIGQFLKAVGGVTVALIGISIIASN